MIEQNQQLAELFDEIANALTYQGENHFKVRAYIKFAQLLRELDEPIGAIAECGELDQLPGVGEAIEKKAKDWLERGTFNLLERVRSEVPENARELMKSGVAPRTVKKLEEQANIRTIDELKTAIQNGSLENHSAVSKSTYRELLEWTKR